jgi:signal transduction histidine kinase
MYRKPIFLSLSLSVLWVLQLFATALPPVASYDTIGKLLTSAERLTFDNLTEAQKYADRALAFAQVLQNPKIIYQCYRSKGYIYEQNSRLVEASEQYKLALSLQSQISDSAKTDIFIDYAIVNKKMGNYKVASEYYNYALKTAERNGDMQMVSYAYNGLATLHSVLTDYEKAIFYYRESIKVVEKKGDIADAITPYRNIGLTYLKSQDYVSALKNAEISYHLALQEKDSNNIASGLETMSKILLEKGDAQTALAKNKEAIRIMEKLGNNKRVILDMLVHMGDIYARLNQFDQAEYFYNRCLVYKDFFDYLTHPNFYHKLGNLYLNKGEVDKAFSAFERSLRLSTEGGFKDLILKNNKAIAKIYKRKGEHAKAYLCLETAQTYADSIFNEEKIRNITASQFIYDAKKSEEKVKDLQQQQSLTWMVAALMLLGIITVSLAFLQRQSRRNNDALVRKNSEIKLQNRRLEESNEILRQFAYASAHDLKEPLRSISSFTNIIKRRYIALLPPEAEEYMTFVTTGVKRMESLLSALLEYSTLIADNNEVAQATPIQMVLEDVTKNLHLIISEKQASVEYPLHMPAVRMSRLHMTQLFQNLIGNALKFCRQQPVIKVNCTNQKDKFIISIADNGIGIKPEYSDKIFRLFQRLDRSQEGTGIGLTICKNIVDKYGGDIWFESKEGVGTTFFIALPVELMQTISFADASSESGNHKQGMHAKLELSKA